MRQRSISAGIAEYEGAAVNWLIEDPQAGTAGLCGEQGVVLTPLLPFGEGTACDAISSGYDGMRRDPVTGSYHAGNGYRCYVPGLHRYSQPDWLSPFGEGGLNDYIHCPDPINLHDPSGAMMVSRWGQEQMLGQLDQALRDTQPMPVGGRWRGMALSAVLTVAGIGMSLVTLGTGSALVFAALSALSAASLALEVSSVLLEESHPKLSKALGIASTVTGVLSIGSVAGVFKQAAAVLRTAGKIALRTINTAKIVISAGWKFAKVAWRSGFTAARNAFTAAWKARNAARQGAKALLKAARETAGAGLGSLSTRQVGFAVEGQKVVTVRGWQARLYAQTSTLPKSVEFCISAFGVADAMKGYAEALGDIVGDDEDDKPEEGDMLTDMVWLEEKMRSAAIA